MILGNGITVGLRFRITPFTDSLKNNDTAGLENLLNGKGLVRGRKYSENHTAELHKTLSEAGLSKDATESATVQSNLPSELYSILLTHASIYSKKQQLSEEMKNLLLDYSLSEINQQKFFDYILLHIGDRITQKEIFGKNFSHPCWNFLIANQYGDKLKDFLYAAISQSKDNFVLFASFVWEGYIKNDLDQLSNP